MRSRRAPLALALLAIAPAPAARADTDQLLRLRSRGQGFYDNNDFARAIEEYSAAFSRSRDARDRFNLGLARLLSGQYTQARRELSAVASARPDDPAPRYALAILAKRTRRVDEALEHLDAVLARDPHCPATLFNKGLLLQDKKADEAGAMAAYERVLALGWTTGGLHFVSALYRHARLVLFKARAKPGGDPDLMAQAKRELSSYQRYQAVLGAAPDETALEDGPYLWPKAVPAPRAPVEGEAEGVEVRFEEATRKAGLAPRPSPAGEVGAGPGGPGVAVCDVDRDGLPDLFEFGNGPPRFWRNQGGHFADGTRAGGLALIKDDRIRHVACGDYDNDGDLDVYLANDGPGRLLKVDGGRFVDATAAAGVRLEGPAAAALWLDADHDGDLDLYVAHHAGPDGKAVPNVLFLNLGLTATFERQTGVAGLTEGAAPARAVVAFDHDLDKDIDLLVANEAPWTMLFSSLREGRYEEVSRRLGLADDALRATGAHAADLDGDGRVDLLLETAGGVRALANRKDGFEPLPLPEGPPRVLPVDVRLTGRHDLVRWGPEGGEVWLAGDSGGWVAGPALPAVGAPIGRLLAADVDRNGTSDLVAATAGGLKLLRNASKPGCRFVRLRLQGVKNNRSGAGTTVELRAGPLYALRVADGQDLTIGFDGHGPVDTVRVTWPNGILQQEIEPAACQTVQVKEAGGLPSSCPFLYAWDGERMAFVMDVLGAAPLGIPARRGAWLPSDPTEYSLVSGDLLVADGRGRLRLSVTEELREETLYLDEAALVAVDHPRGTRVVPNERYAPPPGPKYRLFAFPEATARPPRAATDTFGNDVLDRVRAEDGVLVGSFVASPGAYAGTVEEHAYVLDPGDLKGATTVWLVATGWIYWGGGSAGVATSQDPDFGFGPVRLDVRQDGEWVTGLADIGFPAGKTRAMPVDLSGVLRDRADSRIRLVTTLRLHWDAFSFVVDPPDVPLRETRLRPAAADLRWFGFARRVDDDRTKPERFVYADKRTHAPWDQMAGMLTRYGDVRELVGTRDDRLAVFSAGDELALEFDSHALPVLEEGWRRDYLLYLDGWNKDGDFNNAQAQQVEPLPFHGMSGYPYGPDEHFPDDEAHRRYRAEWNTRPGRRLVTDLRP